MVAIPSGLNEEQGDVFWLRLDCANDPLTDALQAENIAAGDGTISPSDNHSIIVQEFFTANDSITKVGLGCFPHYNPTVSGVRSAAAIQGNQWFGTTNWAAGSVVRCLDFFPAPDTAVGTNGSASLDISGIITGGILNVGSRTIVANNITGIAVAPYSSIFGGAGVCTFSNVRGIVITASLVPIGIGSIGGLTGLQVDQQPTAVNITTTRGIWLNGTAAGGDLVLGTNDDGRIYHSGANLIIDPDNFNAGERVFIGVTGDDDMLLNDIEIDGDLDHDGTLAGFYGTAPIVQPTTAGTAQAAHVGVGGGNVQVNDTFGGWTIGEIIQGLLDLGLFG